MSPDSPEASKLPQLSENDKWLLEVAEKVLVGNFEDFAEVESGSTHHRYDLNVTSLRMDKLFGELRGSGVPEDVPLPELRMLSIDQVWQACSMLKQRLEELRAEATAKKAEEKGGGDSSTVSHFRKAIEHLKDAKGGK